MVYHVGIDPCHGQLLYCNEKDKNNSKIVEINDVINDEVGNVGLIFDKINSKLKNKKFGCACICLTSKYTNKIRQKFIECGILKCEFKSVEIINFETAIYLNAMSQIKYKPANGNIIWIYWEDYFLVWKICNQKAKFIGQWYANTSIFSHLERIVIESELYKGPDIVLYKNTINKATFIELSRCQFFSYLGNSNDFSKAILLKARITAGDQKVIHLETEKFLSQNITLKIGECEIACLKAGQQLPINFSKKLMAKSDDKFLEIIREFCKGEIFELPKNYSDQCTELCFKFEIDVNEIYLGRFDEILVEYNSNTKFDFNETYNKPPLPPPPPPPRNTSLNFDICYTIPQKNILLTNSNIQAIGIDLGTSRCCVAINRNGVIATVPLDNTGERLLPSYVAYDEENVKCGKVVVNRLRHFSNSTIFDSKRIIGREFNDIEIDENWDFCLTSEEDKVFLEIIGFNGEQKITAEEVASDLLKYMKKKAEEFQGTTITKVVITVPAAFTDSQKIATISAAKLAGWKNIQILPEPIAAAFAYFVDRTTLNNSTVLLFDLGGGTLDVCIFEVERETIKMLSNTGDSKLGGRNFDTVLINYFKNVLNKKHGITDLKDKKYKIMLESQRIKEDLTSIFNSSLDVDEYDTNKQGIISISREEFQRMTQPLLNRVQNTIHSALFKSDLKENEIDKVLLVGGGSRMPMIKHLLLEKFPFAEHCIEEHPDEVVAIGAAYYAYSIYLNKII